MPFAHKWGTCYILVKRRSLLDIFQESIQYNQKEIVKPPSLEVYRSHVYSLTLLLICLAYTSLSKQSTNGVSPSMSLTALRGHKKPYIWKSCCRGYWYTCIQLGIAFLVAFLLNTNGKVALFGWTIEETKYGEIATSEGLPIAFTAHKFPTKPVLTQNREPIAANQIHPFGRTKQSASKSKNLLPQMSLLLKNLMPRVAEKYRETHREEVDGYKRQIWDYNTHPRDFEATETKARNKVTDATYGAAKGLEGGYYSFPPSSSAEIADRSHHSSFIKPHKNEDTSAFSSDYRYSKLPSKSSGEKPVKPTIPEALIKERLALCDSVRVGNFSLSGWELMQESERCTFWRRRIPGSPIFEYLARGRFDDISVTAYNKTVNDLAFRKTWDDATAELYLIESYFTSDDPDEKEDLGGSADAETLTLLNGVTNEEVYACAQSSDVLAVPSELPADYAATLSKASGTHPFSSDFLEPCDKRYVSCATKEKHHLSTITSSYSRSAKKAELSAPSAVATKGLQDLEEIIYWRFRLPWPVPSRDFVYSRRIKDLPDRKVLLTVEQATVHPDCPEVRKYVRILNYTSAVALYPTNPTDDFDKPGMEYVMFHSDDPRVNLPDWVTTYIIAQMIPTSIEAMHKTALKLGPTAVEVVATPLEVEVLGLGVSEPPQAGPSFPTSSESNTVSHQSVETVPISVLPPTEVQKTLPEAHPAKQVPPVSSAALRCSKRPFVEDTVSTIWKQQYDSASACIPKQLALPFLTGRQLGDTRASYTHKNRIPPLRLMPLLCKGDNRPNVYTAHPMRATRAGSQSVAAYEPYALDASLSPFVCMDNMAVFPHFSHPASTPFALELIDNTVKAGLHGYRSLSSSDPLTSPDLSKQTFDTRPNASHGSKAMLVDAVPLWYQILMASAVVADNILDKPVTCIAVKRMLPGHWLKPLCPMSADAYLVLPNCIKEAI